MTVIPSRGMKRFAALFLIWAFVMGSAALFALTLDRAIQALAERPMQ